MTPPTLANALHGLAAAAGRVLWLQANFGAGQVRGQGLALGGGACGRAQLLQALLCGGDVFFVGLFKELGLGRVHGLGLGGKAQVAQHANLVREGVDPGLAQEQLGALLVDELGAVFGLSGDALKQAVRQRAQRLFVQLAQGLWRGCCDLCSGG